MVVSAPPFTGADVKLQVNVAAGAVRCSSCSLRQRHPTQVGVDDYSSGVDHLARPAGELRQQRIGALGRERLGVDIFVACWTTRSCVPDQKESVSDGVHDCLSAVILD